MGNDSAQNSGYFVLSLAMLFFGSHSLRFYFIFLCTVYVSCQSFSNCKTKACILWTHSASFTWFGALKLCNQWNACFCGTSCFKRRLPHLLEMYSPGCCTGISFIPNTYLMLISELLGLPKERGTDKFTRYCIKVVQCVNHS